MKKMFLLLSVVISPLMCANTPQEGFIKKVTVVLQSSNGGELTLVKCRLVD